LTEAPTVEVFRFGDVDEEIMTTGEGLGGKTEMDVEMEGWLYQSYAPTLSNPIRSYRS
jgi:hypothetical protein